MFNHHLRPVVCYLAVASPSFNCFVKNIWFCCHKHSSKNVSLKTYSVVSCWEKLKHHLDQWSLAWQLLLNSVDDILTVKMACFLKNSSSIEWLHAWKSLNGISSSGLLLADCNRFYISSKLSLSPQLYLFWRDLVQKYLVLLPQTWFENVMKWNSQWFHAWWSWISILDSGLSLGSCDISWKTSIFVDTNM